MISGLLILINKGKMGKIGALLLVLAVSFVLATKDNPFLSSNLKSIKNDQGQRNLDFMKHISCLGAALLMLVH